jgi:uncharacterized protein YecE (DUF72 family)
MVPGAKGEKGAGRPRARIGTSGWNYPGWRDDFYAGVPQRNWLAFCASQFTAIEVNATFYREQKPATFARWREETPDDFAFAIKGHRFITHVKRLGSPQDSVVRQRDNAAELKDKLAVVLWQLPGNFKKNVERLMDFLEALGAWPQVHHAIEFRHESWFDDEVAAALGRYGVANCISDAADWPIWEAVTTDLVYVRLHGHERTYASCYSEKQLAMWARRARGWLDEGRAVHVAL